MRHLAGKLVQMVMVLSNVLCRVPYEKGFLLLLQLEQLVGGKDKMIDWLRKVLQDCHVAYLFDCSTSVTSNTRVWTVTR